MAQTLKIQEEPDFEILVSCKDSFSTGVPVGYDEPITPAPEVSRKRSKQSNLDPSEYMEEARNYKSAVENRDGFEAKFREDEALGMMFPTTMGVLKEKYPDKAVLVAAMGAIKKSDGSVRPIHDGTHFVQANNGIQFSDKLDHPGPPDVAGAVRAAKHTLEAMFTVSADIKAVHKLVKIRESDWRLLVCKSDSDSNVCWVNKLVYVDDLHVVAVGEQKFEALWMALAASEALGTPFGYKKFAGGRDVQIVGYRIVSLALQLASVKLEVSDFDFLKGLRRDGSATLSMSTGLPSS
eukprot:s2825_g6.t1